MTCNLGKIYTFTANALRIALKSNGTLSFFFFWVRVQIPAEYNEADPWGFTSFFQQAIIKSSLGLDHSSTPEMSILLPALTSRLFFKQKAIYKYTATLLYICTQTHMSFVISSLAFTF